MAHYRLKLFVSGRDQRTERAIQNLRRICREHFGNEWDLQVVSILEQPEEAEKYHILATPTLIKESPEPVRRIIGDLSDTKFILQCLASDEPK